MIWLLNCSPDVKQQLLFHNDEDDTIKQFNYYNQTRKTMVYMLKRHKWKYFSLNL